MHPVETYIDGVLDGSTVVCKFVRLAVERHVKDLRDGAARGLWFDRAAAGHAIDFFKFLRHSKGEWAGQIFELGPFQQFILWVVFGWKRKDGTRRFREVYEEIARKNGKSSKLAGVGLYLFFGDREPGAEVYTAATKRDQARITHSEAKRMVQSSPALKKRIKIYKDNLSIEATASKFEPLGADADTMDGLNVHGAIVDELHAHKTRDVCDVLDTATGARRQPLVWYITTAGYGQTSVCWEKREYARKVLTGIIPDDDFFGIIFTLDTKADWPELHTPEEAAKVDKKHKVEIEDHWDDEAVWVKANPNLGVSCKIDDLRRKARKAKNDPGALNSFLQLHMNIWTAQSSRWMPMIAWDGNGAPFDPQILRGKPCFGGLDLAATTDLCALGLVFPIADVFKVLPFFWIPEDTMRERVERDKVPYDVWVRQGLITATPGNVVDYDFIEVKLDELRDTYDLQSLAYDRWGATKLVTNLQKKNYPLVPFGQGFASMSGPSKELMTLVLSNKFHHGGNPVLRWNADNTVVLKDPAGNIKPDKAKSSQRIDGIVAVIMGLDRALRGGGQATGKSVYDTRGIRTL